MSRSLPLVVVIPGIGGSELADGAGRAVYGSGVRRLVGSALDPGALDIDNELRPVGLIGPCSVLFKQLVTGYDGLLRGLSKRLGLSREQVVTAGPDLVAPDAALVAFPYDFRRSVEQVAHDLDREVRRRAQGRRVVLVAHSMGGLVAAWWWAFLSEGVEVADILTLGTPYRGAAKALDVLVNGVRVGGHELSSLTGVLRTWDSVFDLLPHYQVVEDGGGGPYPYQLPSTVTEAVPDFSARALKAYRANRDMHRALVEKAGSGGNPFTSYYSQGHATLGRAIVDAASGQLEVAKGNPQELPPSWDGGDGTVPVFSTIPDSLEDDVNRRRRLVGKHQDLVEEKPIFDHVSEHLRDRLPPAAQGGARDEGGAYVQLDLDDVLPIGESQAIRMRVVDSHDQILEVSGVGGNVGGQRFRAEHCEDGWWSARLPALEEEGVHQLTVMATGVPGADRMLFNTRVGAASCVSE